MTTRNWDISFTSVCNDRSSSSRVVTQFWIKAMALYWLRGKCASSTSTTECALHIIQQEIWTATCYKTVLEMHESLYFWNLSQHVFVLDSCVISFVISLKDDAELVYPGSSYWNTLIHLSSFFLVQKKKTQNAIPYFLPLWNITWNTFVIDTDLLY